MASEAKRGGDNCWVVWPEGRLAPQPVCSMSSEKWACEDEHASSMGAGNPWQAEPPICWIQKEEELGTPAGGVAVADAAEPLLHPYTPCEDAAAPSCLDVTWQAVVVPVAVPVAVATMFSGVLAAAAAAEKC